MIKKLKEKEKAIRLRKQGETYSQILSVVPVAKSTLSIWLKEVGIAKEQKQKFTLAKRLSAKRGGEAKRKQRIEKQNKIVSEAKSEIKNISEHELFLIGVALYWAEGTKEKEYRPGSGVQFSNMDPRIIQVFLKWVLTICKIPKDMLVFDIFLHENHINRLGEVKRYWSGVVGINPRDINRVYWKRNKVKVTNRKNTGEKYFGVLKIKVKRSSSLVRKIAGWSDGLYKSIVI